MPRIPVVIPAYNEERSIGPLLAELCAAMPENVTYTQGRDYNAYTDYDNLAQAVLDHLDGKTVKLYYYKENKRRSLQFCDIPTTDLTNHNRVEFCKYYYNSFTQDDNGDPVYSNANYLLKGTAYLVKDGTVTFSDSSVYFCYKNIAAMNSAFPTEAQTVGE